MSTEANKAADEHLQYIGMKSEVDALYDMLGGRTKYPGTDWGRTLVDEVLAWHRASLASESSARQSLETQGEPMGFTRASDEGGVQEMPIYAQPESVAPAMDGESALDIQIDEKLTGNQVRCSSKVYADISHFMMLRMNTSSRLTTPAQKEKL